MSANRNLHGATGSSSGLRVALFQVSCREIGGICPRPVARSPQSVWFRRDVPATLSDSAARHPRRTVAGRRSHLPGRHPSLDAPIRSRCPDSVLVQEELIKARSLHSPIASMHEGYAVILEELDEL